MHWLSDWFGQSLKILKDGNTKDMVARFMLGYQDITYLNTKSDDR